MPLQATSGAASYDAFGGGVPVVPTYIEDVFSTWLYTGNDSTQTITNGIDLASKGGLVWGKSRTDGSNSHRLQDTARGVGNEIFTNLTNAQNTGVTGISSFNSNGFTLSGSFNNWNNNNALYASWTFRKQPKFFDVVTYTGNGNSSQTIAHNLGSVPGCIIAKGTSNATDWPVYHRSLNGGTTPEQWYLRLNATAAQTNAVANWGNIAPTATQFTVGANNNVSGYTYVAYLFAHNAGGFGLTGTDNVISCGSYVGNSTSGVSVNLGFEPQWILFKNVTTGGANSGWYIHDNMRGLPAPPSLSITRLQANTSGAEEVSASSSGVPQITATGFNLSPNESTGYNKTGDTYIYIAIRRGPMRTPTSGTSVFSPTTASAEPSSTPLLTGGGFPSDLVLHRPRITTSVNYAFYAADRLRGRNIYLRTHATAAEADSTSAVGLTYWQFDRSDAAYIAPSAYFNNNGEGNIGYALYSLRRAPGFFDVVCYTGDATTPRTINHNLGVAPELIITKQRDTARSWPVRITPLGNSVLAFLNLTDASSTSASRFPVATYTGSTYVIGSDAVVNASGGTYVAYLFASCPGVSKVGSFTNSGSDVNVDCGFTAGARFILIRRSSNVDDWYVYDSARGITTGNDPYLTLNTTAAEVTNSDGIAPLSSGFTLKGSQWNNGTYIFLAIA